MTPFSRLLPVLAMSAMMAGCGSGIDDDVTRVAFVGSSSDLSDSGFRLSPAAQHIRSATTEGLVSLNDVGEVLPAVAESWIVTDDGLSYIFRLRNSDWSDGTALTSQNVRQALQNNVDQLAGTSLGVDLAIISDIRAMAGRVIEIRLRSPMPQFLQLIAQPELGLRRERVGVGPMTASQSDNGVLLSVLPPERRGQPTLEDWQEQFRQVHVQAMRAEEATESFDNGQVEAVFNGDLLSFPLAERGPLSSGTLRLDGVFGLFGLQIMHSEGLFDEVELREALAMGIDRSTILEPFSLAGWVSSTRILPASLPNDLGAGSPRWADMSFEQRRSEARGRIFAWRIETQSEDAAVSIDMPTGSGADTLFAELASDFDAIGVTLERAEPGARPDLRFVDSLARYADRRWFLNQFNCELERGLCSPEADALVLDAIGAVDPAEKARLLAEAENELLAKQAYIPFGSPIRWSLIRGGVEGFSENSWGLHPLFPLALRPI